MASPRMYFAMEKYFAMAQYFATSSSHTLLWSPARHTGGLSLRCADTRAFHTPGRASQSYTP